MGTTCLGWSVGILVICFMLVRRKGVYYGMRDVWLIFVMLLLIALLWIWVLPTLVYLGKGESIGNKYQGAVG